MVTSRGDGYLPEKQIPDKGLRGKTPYEALYKRSNLTIIGSKAWVAIPQEKLRKMDARSAESHWIRCLDTVYPIPRKRKRGHIL